MRTSAEIESSLFAGFLDLGLGDFAGFDTPGAGPDARGAAIDIGAQMLKIGQNEAVVAPGNLASGAAFCLVLAFAGHHFARQWFFTAVITDFTHYFCICFMSIFIFLIFFLFIFGIIPIAVIIAIAKDSPSGGNAKGVKGRRDYPMSGTAIGNKKK